MLNNNLSAQLEEVPGDDEPLAVVHLMAAPSGCLLPLAALLLLDWLSLHRGRLGLAGDTAVSTRLAWTVQYWYCDTEYNINIMGG